MISRIDRGFIANWIWIVDRYILIGCFFLITIGMMLSFSVSPLIAKKIGISDDFSFFRLHIEYTMLAIIIMITFSFISPTNIFRISSFFLLVSIIFLILSVFSGIEIKGARRWISVFKIIIQPSEFMKPVFIIVIAWCFSQWKNNRRFLFLILSLILYIICSTLLIIEPDIGQTVLISITSGSLFFVSGISLLITIFLIICGIFGLMSSYFLLSYVHERIYRFFTGEGDTFQVDVSRKAIIHGGWFGVGPGEGTIKNIIPDSYTDFIFSVIAEEYGIILCIIIIILFTLIVVRSLYVSLNQPDYFIKLATSGIAMLFGFQAIIHISVNLCILPSKGMTLPFISYGGSSLITTAFSAGCLLSFTRKFPQKKYYYLDNKIYDYEN